MLHYHFWMSFLPFPFIALNYLLANCRVIVKESWFEGSVLVSLSCKHPSKLWTAEAGTLQTMCLLCHRVPCPAPPTRGTGGSLEHWRREIGLVPSSLLLLPVSVTPAKPIHLDSSSWCQSPDLGGHLRTSPDSDLLDFHTPSSFLCSHIPGGDTCKCSCSLCYLLSPFSSLLLQFSTVTNNLH